MHLQKSPINIYSFFLVLLSVTYVLYATYIEEEEVSKYLQAIDRNLTERRALVEKATYMFKVKRNENTTQCLLKAKKLYRLYLNEVVQNLLDYDFMHFQNKSLKRQVESIVNSRGSNALNEDDATSLTTILTDMRRIPHKLRSCENGKRCFCKPFNFTKIMATSESPEELKHYWLEWHDRSGDENLKLFQKYLTLSQKAAEMNLFLTKADMVLSKYHSETLENDLDSMFHKFLPYYEQLHAYIRYKLKKKYGEEVSDNEPIPIHLVGNMYGNNWENAIKPEKNKTRFLVLFLTAVQMIRKIYDFYKLLKWTNKFLESIDMPRMSEVIMVKSSVEAAKNAICDPSGYVFEDEDQIRVHVCTGMTFLSKVYQLVGNLVTKEKGLDQPYGLRRHDIPELDRTLGNVMSLSSLSSKHLKRVGIIKEINETEEYKIQSLLQKSLSIFPKLAFAYTMIKYRFDIYRKHLTQFNCGYWRYHAQYSGLQPPEPRSEKNFDPAAKPDFASDKEQYLEIYISTILQYMFYKSACVLANEYEVHNPEKVLHECDIYGSKTAGKMLNDAFSLDAAQTWQEILQKVTGSEYMSIDPLLEYYEPLYFWLKAENEKNGVKTIGWSKISNCYDQNIRNSANISGIYIAIKLCTGSLFLILVRIVIL